MSHVPFRRLHAYSGRGLPLLILIATTLNAADCSNARFASDAVNKSGLAVSDIANGISVYVPFTDDELNIPPGKWDWELIADVASSPTTLMVGSLTIEPPPT